MKCKKSASAWDRPVPWSYSVSSLRAVLHHWCMLLKHQEHFPKIDYVLLFPLCAVTDLRSARTDNKKHLKVYYLCRIFQEVSYWKKGTYTTGFKLPLNCWTKQAEEYSVYDEVIFPSSIKTVIYKINMAHITLNIVLWGFSTHVIITQTVTQRCSNQFLAAKQITVHICKMAFMSNNTRKLNNFILQNATIYVETEKHDLGIHEM